MKKWKNNLDEMQEQKLRQIESGGCWLAFWGLLLSIAVQSVLYTGTEAGRAIAGEWIVFMVLSVYIMVRCLKNGLWDRRLRPNAKTNLIASLIAGAVCGIFLFTTSYVRYHKLQGSLFGGLITCAAVTALCFAALMLSARIVKKKEAALEAEPEEADEDVRPE